LEARIAKGLGAGLWFSVFVRYYEAHNDSVYADYIVYNWSKDNDFFRDYLKGYASLSLGQTNPVDSSSGVSISSEAYTYTCLTEDGGLTPGATAGIAIGAIAGGVAGAGALAGLGAAGYAVYRHMNRPPAPEQLASGDTAFVDNTSNDNKLFTSNQAEVQNELYSL
jgi:hypothetical protein